MAKTLRANPSVHEDYRTLAEIGRGAYGVVLKAEHRETGEIRAIKSLYDGAYDEEALHRFKDEAALMHGFDHPNIVQVHEVHLDARSPSIVMDFVDGPDVRLLLKRDGRLPVAEVVHIALDMARAFDHFHPKVVHRDMKPENVLRCPPEASGERARFLLTDFGIARQAESDVKLTERGGQRGTPEYMSPEHVNGQALGPASDFWGLGVVLYEALTGRVPFELQSDRMADLGTLAHAIKTEQPTSIRVFRPEVPDWLDATVLGCLAKAPEARPPSGEALVGHLWRGTVAQIERGDALFKAGNIAAAYAAYDAVEGFFSEGALRLNDRIGACRARLPEGFRPQPPQAPERKPTQRAPMAAVRPAARPLAASPPSRAPAQAASGAGGSRANLWASLAALVLLLGAGGILYIGYNAPPLARDDQAETGDDRAIAIEVLANDADPDMAKPLREETLTLLSVGDPPNGRTRRVGPGVIEYTPDGEFVGEDSFSYVVGDRRGKTAQATVRVSVVESDGTRQRREQTAAAQTARRITAARFSDPFRAALSADPSRVLLDDRLSGNASGWDLASQDSNRVVAIQDGALVLEQRREGFFGSSLLPIAHRDAIVRFTVSQQSGATNNGGGLVFRRDQTGEYTLLVSGDGHIRLARFESASGEWTDLVPWRPSAALRTGLGANNVVEARIQGATVAVYVNGEFDWSVGGLSTSAGSQLGFTASALRRFAFGDLVVVGLDT